MLPVVFLDFDGPLFPRKVHLLKDNQHKLHRRPPEIDELLHPFISYWVMDPIAVAMLNNIALITDAEFVISSSWRELHSKKDIEQLFELNKLNVQLHEDWATPVNELIDITDESIVVRYANRREEILAWIEKHPEVKKWVAIDDDVSIKILPEKHRMLIQEDDGISYQNYRDLLNMLQ